MSFTKLPDRLKRAVKVFNTELEISVNLTPVDKIIWCHMLSKYKSYVKAGLLYFETQEQISEATGVSLRTVNSTVKKLKRLRVLSVQKQRTGKNKFVNVYTKVQDPDSTDSLMFFDFKGTPLSVPVYAMCKSCV